MAKASGVLSSHLFAALFLASVVLVKSLPTSVLVDSKQQQQQQLQQLHQQQQEQIEKQPPSPSVHTINKGRLNFYFRWQQQLYEQPMAEGKCIHFICRINPFMLKTVIGCWIFSDNRLA